MPKIILKNLHHKVIDGNQKGESILSLFQSNNQDWMHACGGKGRCTTCSIIVHAGEENLGPITPNEQRFIDQGRLAKGVRLACQAICQGDVEIAAPELYKLPHLSYSE
ncbi:MAG: 2Fe-2S iron-sulfur cluster-binding protein [Bacteroidota bacterium]